MTFLDDWLKTAQYSLFGPRCMLCGATTTLSRGLCAPCSAELPTTDHRCRHCALALPADGLNEVCSSCRRSPRFDAAVAALIYREPVRWLVARLKFQARMSHARLLGDLLADAASRAPGVPAPDAFVPVPLHIDNRRRRGFNQAEEITRPLAARLDRPIWATCIERIRPTEPQSGLPAARRAANVRGAFACQPGRRDMLAGAHVAIVDDVVTTTGTAVAVRDCLRDAGAARIDLYCVARA